VSHSRNNLITVVAVMAAAVISWLIYVLLLVLVLKWIIDFVVAITTITGFPGI
jgi:hypothetical protein